MKKYINKIPMGHIIAWKAAVLLKVFISPRISTLVRLVCCGVILCESCKLPYFSFAICGYSELNLWPFF